MNLSPNPRKGIRTKDTNMQRLVEEYLIQNCERTYIDMEDMITALQTKSYHFSRMKKQTFANLVRDAYYTYCDQNQIYYDADKNSGNASVIGGQRPGTSQPAADSDSDIEIEEQSPVSTVMNNQMTGLYARPQVVQQSPSTSDSLLNSFSFIRQPPNAGRSFTSLSAVRKNQTGENTNTAINSNSITHPNPRHKANEQRGELLSSGSSSSTNSGSDGLLLVEPLDLDGKDDDDLEIIEEFSNPRVVARRSLLPKDKSVDQQLNEAVKGGSKALPSSVVGVPVSMNANIKQDDKAVQVFFPEIVVPSKAVVIQEKAVVPVPVKVVSEHVEKESQERTKVTIVQDLTEERKGVKRTRVGPRAESSGSMSTSSSTGINKLKEAVSGTIAKKVRKEIAVVQESNYTFADFGGSEKVLEEICKLLMHLKHPEMYRTLGVTPPRGFLLHGPPGCGKTLLANAIAGELKMSMLKMAATELISGISGESENNIRDLFDQALGLAPCIIFIDEIDSITPKRETAQREMERRIVAQLLACIDDLINKEKGDQVLLIGATNRIEAIDNSLRRAGRFDREICLGIPDEKAREKIFRVISRGLKLEADFSFEVLAKLTPGYVGADLQALVREAAVQSVTDILSKQTSVAGEPMDEDTQKLPRKNSGPDSMEMDVGSVQVETFSISPIKTLKWIKEETPLSQEELENFCIHMKDFERALKNVQPSSKREGFVTVPDTTWEDIGALKEIRDELQVSILGPVKHSVAFQALGLNSPAGVLLCGPPGCGKTLLAKAVANEAGINFISVKGPELLNMYVGESERAVRQCFLRAKNSSPCVIFFDELDALCPRRSDSGGDSGSSSRVVNQLLTEMDGMESRLGVFVMAATNRPDIVDPAVLRPGRLDKILFVNLPTPADRVDILKAITKSGTKPILADDVKIEEIGNNEKCENYTGADLASLIREAGIAAFRELILDPGMKNEATCPEKDLKVYQRHFDVAFTKTKPSVSKKDREKYDQMREKYSSLSTQ